MKSTAKNLLIVVDMQNDFIDGSLGTPEAKVILPRAIDKAKYFNGDVWLTQDTHYEDYLQTQEGENLPVVHCVEGSEGWKLHPQIDAIRRSRNSTVFKKNTFASEDLADAVFQDYQAGKVASVTLIGLCTDICVVSNALLLKAKIPELRIYIDEKCCAGVTPQKHNAAIETMRSCQIEIL